MKWLGPLLMLAMVACQASPPPSAQVPPPEEDETAPSSPVVSAPAPANRAAMTERRLVLTIGADADPVLVNLAAALLDPRLRDALVEVNGHTAAGGPLGDNLALSFVQAQAVVQHLVVQGVPAGRLRAQGFGPLQLVDTANPLSPANQRVEVVALSR